MSFVFTSESEKKHYYKALASDLFESQEQLWVPFLGAGVSTSGKPQVATIVQEDPPEINDAMSYLKRQLGLKEPLLLFVRFCLKLALELNRHADQDQDIKSILKSRTYPPTAAELTELFRTNSAFEWAATDLSWHLGHTEQNAVNTVRELMDKLAPLAGVSAPALPVMAACYELLHGRDDLLGKLVSVMNNNNYVVTKTHSLIARVAKHHVNKNKCHFLIITTNYDSLMEKALKGGPPYVVLSANRNDFLVKTHFGNISDDQYDELKAINQPRSPKLYTLVTPTDTQGNPSIPLVIIYKLHGCINELQRCPLMHGEKEEEGPCSHDGIILSDEDYLRNIARLADNDGVVPAFVKDLLDKNKKRILFLGYSLSDWNVRGLLRAFRDHENRNDNGRPARRPDLSVARRLSALEQRFYEGNKINVMVEDLNVFSPRIEEMVDRISE
jgi:hypothetical protein